MLWVIGVSADREFARAIGAAAVARGVTEHPRPDPASMRFPREHLIVKDEVVGSRKESH
jgi:hypothetical protein